MSLQLRTRKGERDGEFQKEKAGGTKGWNLFLLDIDLACASSSSRQVVCKQREGSTSTSSTGQGSRRYWVYRMGLLSLHTQKLVSLTGLVAFYLLGAMFPLPRILYAMGSDGVIFKFLGEVHPRFQTPVLGTAISGLFAGVMAMIFNLAELVEMLSIGTLLAYTLVAVSVLILRYETDANLPGRSVTPGSATAVQRSVIVFGEVTMTPFRFKHLFVPDTGEPTERTSRITKYSMASLAVLITALCLVGIEGSQAVDHHRPWAIILMTLLALAILVCSLVIYLQPQNPVPLPFKTPLVPWVPILSCLINIYLMLKLSPMTWKRFGVWMGIGFFMYFGYGIRQAGRVREASRDTQEESGDQRHLPDIIENDPHLSFTPHSSTGQQSRNYAVN